MKKAILIILILITQFPNYLISQEQELRGVWIAWAGSNVPSKEKITQMMEEVAAANMNTVYVDCWRYGYPYFYSQVFHDITGLWTDPNLEAGRDVLAEMIAEGHRVGLHVEAWFEYGFVACQGNIDQIYQAHPEWFAKKRNGAILFNGDYQYKWLSHCNPEAQQFLIDLCQEVALKYDVDGIELDRVRYPELDCGYDSVTVALYQQEHNGTPPPQNIAHSGWMRWRADKLTEFMAALYDSLKAVRPDLPVSNAPIVYSYGYDNFCQDWRPWINNGYLDFISPQVYRSSNANYVYELNIQSAYVTDQSKLYPGLTSVYDQYLIPTNEIVAMIQSTRNKNLQGHVIWFYDTLADDLPGLKSSVYQQQAHVPNMPDDWRKPAIIINEDDPGVQKSSGWNNYTGISGFEGGCVYVKTDDFQWIDYYANIPKDGWYEIYCYNIVQWNATKDAPYEIFSAHAIDSVTVDQTKTGLAKWHKLGDFYFEQADSQRIIRLSNADIGDKILFADAIMIVNTNRPMGSITKINVDKKTEIIPKNFELYQNFPNPFNSDTTIKFSLLDTEQVLLKIYDIQGKEISTLIDD
ncbi:hypothetical protein EH223_12900, partial [candidate division KSB1 bacterium]